MKTREKHKMRYMCDRRPTNVRIVLDIVMRETKIQLVTRRVQYGWARTDMR